MTQTANRNYPLVDPRDSQRVGAARINAALGAVDGDFAQVLLQLVALQEGLAGKVNATALGPAIQAAIDALVAGAPAALDTLVEIADKLADNDDALAAILSSLATKANAGNVYSRSFIDDALSSLAGTMYTRNAVDAALSSLKLTSAAYTLAFGGQ